jgi:hypothetical protein
MSPEESILFRINIFKLVFNTNSYNILEIYLFLKLRQIFIGHVLLHFLKLPYLTRFRCDFGSFLNR